MTRLRSRAARSREGGFTMVELMASVAILGIISTSLGVVGVVMFKTMGQTQNRLDESRGPRFASVYWIPDVASADKVNPDTVGLPTVCGATGPLVTLQWTDTTTTGFTTVSYGFVSTAGVSKLERRFCVGGSSTPSRVTTIAPNVVTADTQVTCGDRTTACATPMPSANKLLVLKVAAQNGGTFSVDAFREVT